MIRMLDRAFVPTGFIMRVASLCAESGTIGEWEWGVFSLSVL